jgi:hypothetical protein
MHRGRAAAGGARAMLRYRCPGPLAGWSACRLLVARLCGCGPLCNQSCEFEPGSGETRAEPYDDVIQAQVRFGDARSPICIRVWIKQLAAFWVHP